MNAASVVALFCDDIREEKFGTFTIVGVYPDNLQIKQMPGTFAKMSVYVRMHIPVDCKPGKIVTRIFMPDGVEVNSDEADAQVVTNALENAIKAGGAYAGLIARFTMLNLRVTAAGRMQVKVGIGDKEYIAGTLNLKLAPADGS
jgi:hypothetical protein